jgi:hypothetical protein
MPSPTASNHVRPHDALAGQTPAALSQDHQRGDSALSYVLNTVSGWKGIDHSITFAPDRLVEGSSADNNSER